MTTVVRVEANRNAAVGARARYPRAFTLIELLVVIAIVLILIGIAAPAIGPVMSSNHTTRAIIAMNGLITTAQTAAEANFTSVGIRIERAFETDANGYMVDVQGDPIDSFDTDGFPSGASAGRQPKWLPHQQARFVIQGVRYPGGGLGEYGFRHMANTRIVELPRGAWLAPAYYADTTHAPHPSFATSYMPALANANANAPNNRFSTFYIMFNREGELMRTGPSAGGSAEPIWYVDETALTPSFVQGVDCSARGVVAYDRQMFLDQADTFAARQNYLRRQGQPVYINRVLGSTMEGRTQ